MSSASCPRVGIAFGAGAVVLAPVVGAGAVGVVPIRSPVVAHPRAVIVPRVADRAAVYAVDRIAVGASSEPPQLAGKGFMRPQV